VQKIIFYAAIAIFFPLTSGAQAAQATSLPPDVISARKTEASYKLVAYREETVKFALASGRKIEAHIRVPDQVRSAGQKYPAIMIFGGFEEAGKVLSLVTPKVPVVLASFDYPFDPPRKFEFPESLQFLPDARRAVRETFEGMQELYNTLRLRHDVDLAKISLVGASFGAPLAVTAAANEPGISGLIVVQGFAQVPEVAMHQLLRKWQPIFGRFAKPLAWVLTHAGWLYLGAPAPEASAKLLSLRQRVLFITAESDSFVPVEASDALWNAIEESSSQRHREIMKGDHLTPGSEALVEKISDLTTNWMMTSGLL
jgi:dienelactone hydrolase